MNNTTGGYVCYVGIDVAKAQLDIAVRPDGQQWIAANDEAGISELVARVQGMQPALVVLEATGGREMGAGRDRCCARADPQHVFRCRRLTAHQDRR